MNFKIFKENKFLFILVIFSVVVFILVGFTNILDNFTRLLTAGPQTGSQPLTPPHNLTASAYGREGINLSWSVVNNIEGYKIYRNGDHIATTASTSYLDTDLWVNTPYTYQVSSSARFSSRNVRKAIENRYM